MQVRTRRFAPDRHGLRVDLRRTLAATLRGGGHGIDLARKEPRRRHPPLVILCDISGSMSRYSRMLLLFMHTVTNDRDRVHSFLFGTRLTNVTRHLRQRDIDPRWPRSAASSRTGPAAPASATACTSSTGSGRAACWARAPSSS
jgi:uncharacterized protein with von Willebrand factor type A (vWA) domain